MAPKAKSIPLNERQQGTVKIIRERGRVQRAGYRTKFSGAVSQESARQQTARTRAQARIDAEQAQTQQFAIRRGQQLSTERQRRVESAVERPILSPGANGLGIWGNVFRVFAIIIGLSALYLIVRTSPDRSAGAIKSLGGILQNITSSNPLFRSLDTGQQSGMVPPVVPTYQYPPPGSPGNPAAPNPTGGPLPNPQPAPPGP